MADETLVALQTKAANRAIKFNPIEAQRAVRACGDLVGILRAVQEHAALSGGVADLADLAGPYEKFNSGNEWAERFSELGQKFIDVLKTHISTVEQMAEVFRLAGIAFGKAEQQSEDDFRRSSEYLRSTHIPATPNNSVRLVVDLSRMSFENIDTKNVKVPKGYEAPAGGVTPEDPEAPSWHDFYMLGIRIRADAALTAAAEWESMRAQIETAFDNFGKDIKATENGWDSSSGDAARTTVKNYVADSKALATKMGEIRDSMKRAASWLEECRQKMPSTPEPEFKMVDRPLWLTDYWEVKISQNSGDTRWQSDFEYGDGGTETLDAERNALKTVFRNAFRATYVAGIIEFNEKVGTLQPPSTKTVIGSADITQPPPPTDPGPGPAGNGLGNGTGTGTGTGGGGSPAVEEPKVEKPGGGDPQETVPTNPNNGNPTTNNPSTTTDTTLSTLASLASTAITQGASLASSLATTGKEALEKSLTALTSKQSQQQQQEQQGDGSPAVVPTGLGTGGGSGGSAGGGSSAGAGLAAGSARENLQNRLFPRAAVASEEKESVTVSRAGLASTTGTGTTSTTGTGMSGMPMSSGAQAGGQGGGKEHKRAEFLKSDTNLDQVFDEIPAAVRPVAEK